MRTQASTTCSTYYLHSLNESINRLLIWARENTSLFLGIGLCLCLSVSMTLSVKSWSSMCTSTSPSSLSTLTTHKVAPMIRNSERNYLLSRCFWTQRELNCQRRVSSYSTMRYHMCKTLSTIPPLKDSVPKSGVMISEANSNYSFHKICNSSLLIWIIDRRSVLLRYFIGMLTSRRSRQWLGRKVISSSTWRSLCPLRLMICGRGCSCCKSTMSYSRRRRSTLNRL